MTKSKFLSQLKTGDKKNINVFKSLKDALSHSTKELERQFQEHTKKPNNSIDIKSMWFRSR